MIIDFHTHVFPQQVKDDRSSYIARDSHFALLYSNPKAKLATADDLIASMDEYSIDISVILGFNWTSHELCVETNDYILDSIARYSRRLVGFCAITLESGETALKEIERCAQSGIKGVGELRPSPQLLKSKAAMASFVEVLQKHRLILLTHASEPVGHDYPGKGDITPDKLYPIFTGFPNLTIVCAHWGGGLPFYALMPEVKQAMRNVFFDTAASPFLYSPKVYEHAIQLVGADRILFGSDYPLLAQRRLLNEIESLNLPDDTKNMLLSENAQRLLGMRSAD